MNDRPDRCVPSLRGGSSAAGLAYRGVVLAMLLSSIAFTRNAAESAPVSVRFPEGLTHGFLLVRSAAGDIVGHGELTQTVKEGGVAESRLVFRFKDGSLHEEKVAFSQQRVFTLIRYQLTQRGPSSPEQPVSASAVTRDRPASWATSTGTRFTEGDLSVREA